jgi:hypothetical protein
MKTIFAVLLRFLAAMIDGIIPGSVSHVWTTTIKSDLGAVGVAERYTITGDTEENVSNSIAAAGMIDEILPAIDCDTLLSFSIYCDQDITLKFNSRSSPSSPSPISLKAGEAYAWNNKQNISNPLAGLTLSKLIFDNSAGTATANFKAVFLMSVGS